MKAPDKIYVREYPVGLNQEWDEKPRVRTVAIVQHEYIRKDALLEWAKELKERWAEPPVSIHSPGCVYMLEQVIDKLNSM